MKLLLCLFSIIISLLSFSQEKTELKNFNIYKEKLKLARTIVTNRYGDIEHTKWNGFESGFVTAMNIYMDEMNFSYFEKKEKIREVRTLFLEAFSLEEIKILNWETKAHDFEFDLKEQERLSDEYEKRRNLNGLKNNFLKPIPMENEVELKRDREFLKKIFFTENGNLRAEYLGKAGYLKFSKMYQMGDMDKAYKRISKFFKTEYVDFSELKWGNPFEGYSDHYDFMRNFLLQGQQNIDLYEWFGTTNGLNKAVNDFLENRIMNFPADIRLIEKVKRNFMAVVTEIELKGLGWTQETGKDSLVKKVKGLGIKRSYIKNKSTRFDTISVSDALKRTTRK